MGTEFWTTKATTCLDALVSAASLGGYGPAQVARWVAGDASEAMMILWEHGNHQAADAVFELESPSTPQTAASLRLAMSRMLNEGGA